MKIFASLFIIMFASNLFANTKKCISPDIDLSFTVRTWDDVDMDSAAFPDVEVTAEQNGVTKVIPHMPKLGKLIVGSEPGGAHIMISFKNSISGNVIYFENADDAPASANFGDGKSFTCTSNH